MYRAIYGLARHGHVSLSRQTRDMFRASSSMVAYHQLTIQALPSCRNQIAAPRIPPDGTMLLKITGLNSNSIASFLPVPSI